MTFLDMVKGSYGYTPVLEIWDSEDEAAEDISGYSSFAMEFSDPDGIITSKAASLYTDGTDGKIQKTIADGDIDQAGTWKVRARVYTGTSVDLYSRWLIFTVWD